MAKIRYEKMDCPRCGGSGRHSYNEMYGDTCFRCDGSGVVLTAEAARSKKAIRALQHRLTETPVLDVSAGDVVLIGRRWRVIESTAVGVHYYWSGTRIPMFGVKVQVRGSSMGRVMTCDGTLLKRPTGDQVREIVSLARSLPGVRIEGGDGDSPNRLERARADGGIR